MPDCRVGASPTVYLHIGNQLFPGWLPAAISDSESKPAAQQSQAYNWCPVWHGQCFFHGSTIQGLSHPGTGCRVCRNLEKLQAEFQSDSETPLEPFKMPELDLVRPLPTSGSFTHLLTMLDRTAREPEVVLLAFKAAVDSSGCWATGFTCITDQQKSSWLTWTSVSMDAAGCQHTAASFSAEHVHAVHETLEISALVVLLFPKSSSGRCFPHFHCSEPSTSM